MIFLYLTLFLFFLADIVVDRLPEEHQWLFFDVVNSLIFICLSIFVYLQIKFSDHIKKTGTILLVVIGFQGLLELLVFYLYYSHWETVRAILHPISLTIIGMLIAKLKFVPFKITQDKVKPDCLYICKSYGRSWIGVLGSLIYYPFGKGFIICNNLVYTFHNKGLYSTKPLKNFNLTNCDIKYIRKTTPKDIVNLNSFLGRRWTPWLNCININMPKINKWYFDYKINYTS